MNLRFEDTRDLTKRQRQGLQLIVTGFLEQRIPSIRELGEAMGITSTNGVVDHLKALARKDYIVRRFGEARSMELTEKTFAIIYARTYPSLRHAIREGRADAALALLDHIESGRHPDTATALVREERVEIPRSLWDELRTLVNSPNPQSFSRVTSAVRSADPEGAPGARRASDIQREAS